LNSAPRSGASGPLAGFRFLEIAGLGPTQLAGMLLADMGADVLRIERPAAEDTLEINLPRRFDIMNRGRRSVAVDLKQPAGMELVLRLVDAADALYEGFRPGVMERLGLGPVVVLTRNPRLVYGRMTGWGQEGPLALTAGHDPNYIAIAGLLANIGEADGPPVYPTNVIGDYGGGTTFLVIGLLAGLLQARASGRGQVVDAAMVDGAATLATYLFGLLAGGLWTERRGSNFLDGGAHYLRPYQTLDGEYVMLGAIEGRFYQTLLDRLGIDDVELRGLQQERSRWPDFRARLAEVFASRTRAEWDAVFEGSDACYSPVLGLSQAMRHPHACARESFLEIDGIPQPAPAPRFSVTPSRVQNPPPPEAGSDTRASLLDWGLTDVEIDHLIDSGAVIQT
jgi:alpha-methylacyl-CoA racemase